MGTSCNCSDRGCPCPRILAPLSGSGSFSPSRTFWLFLAQVIAADASCREVLRSFLVWLALEEGKTASPSTGAYCKARNRIPLADIEQMHVQVRGAVEPQACHPHLWCGRRVKVIDGSSVSMPDTPDNQERYPQPNMQKAGCGFPVMRIVAVFSLSTGLLLDLAKDALSVPERTLFRRLWDLFEPGDIVLADTGFCSYADFYLLTQRQTDCVMRNHQRRKVGVRNVKKLGKGDRLILWIKTKVQPKWLNDEQWRAIPDTLLVREITITVNEPGFRSKTLVVATTLRDAKRFPKTAIAELYRRRWAAELYLRDIKTALGMDILRCKAPDNVEKELWMHVIAYNLIRALMAKAADAHRTAPDALSFKGTLSTVRQLAPYIQRASQKQRPKLMGLLLTIIAADKLPSRSNRIEPRAKKRRPKNYQLLTCHRSQFKEQPHRNRYKKMLK